MRRCVDYGDDYDDNGDDDDEERRNGLHLNIAIFFLWMKWYGSSKEEHRHDVEMLEQVKLQQVLSKGTLLVVHNIE